MHFQGFGRLITYDRFIMAQALSLDPESMSDVLDQVTKPIASITDVVAETTPILSVETAQIDLGDIL